MSQQQLRYQWQRAVRRYRLGKPSIKSVAQHLALYANTDGTGIRVSLAQLAADCELSVEATRTAMAELRRLGLVVMVRHGSDSGRSGRPSEYELALLADLADRLEPVEKKAPRTPKRTRSLQLSGGDRPDIDDTSTAEHTNWSAEHTNSVGGTHQLSTPLHEVDMSSKDMSTRGVPDSDADEPCTDPGHWGPGITHRDDCSDCLRERDAR